MTPNFLIISTFLVSLLSLPAAYVTNEDRPIRTALLLFISLVFLVNVLFIDFLFLRGVTLDITILAIDKYTLSFHTEPLGLIFLTMLAVLWNCSLLYTIKFLALNEIAHSSRFIMFLNASIITGALVALSANLFSMFTFYELLTLCTIPLIIHQDGENIRKGLVTYLKILMISSMLLFLPAIIFVYAKTGHGIFMRPGIIQGNFTELQTILLLLMFIFGISKTAIFPLHKWLPAAMVASYPVSALLHAVVVVKTGLFCVYKSLVYIFGLSYLQQIFAQHNWLLYLPVITILYSSLQALKYKKIKMILAYSTINQLSVCLLSAFLLTPKGIAAAAIHMVSHSFTKICIFYAAANIYSVKNVYQVTQLIGIKNIMPISCCILLISALSLVGIPPFAGFISKFYIMLAAAEQQNILVMIAVMISSIFSGIYMARILIFAYQPITNNNTQLNEISFKQDEFKNEAAQRILIREHSRASQNSLGSTLFHDAVPFLMVFSLILCLFGVVSFYFILQVINNFLMYI